MTLSPSQLGALRMIVYVGGFAALNAILVFASSAANLVPLVGTGLAAIISVVAASLEQSMAASSGHTTAMFGAVKQS